MGADTAERLETWHRASDVVGLSTIVIVNRDETTNTAPGFLRDARVLNVTMNPVDVSSSSIREAVARGESIDSTTSSSVVTIIRDHSLYVGNQ